MILYKEIIQACKGFDVIGVHTSRFQFVLVDSRYKVGLSLGSSLGFEISRLKVWSFVESKFCQIQIVHF